MKAITEFKGDHRFLSNFWPAKVSFEGVTYPSVEHAYQAAKTVIPEERARIREAASPGKAKRLGQRVTHRPDWEQIRRGVMEALVQEKFTRHTTLQEQLAATAPAELVEGNGWGDTFWGVDLQTGEGQNHLGRILMEVRDGLLANIKTAPKP